MPFVIPNILSDIGNLGLTVLNHVLNLPGLTMLFTGNTFFSHSIFTQNVFTYNVFCV